MRLNDLGILLTLGILLLCAGAALLSVQITGKNDQPIEQAAEAVLKSMTGIIIDFTPNKEP